jgi:hypothetical protein
LRGLQRHALTVKNKPALQLSPIEKIGGQLSPLIQESKGGKAHSEVGLVHAAILLARRQVILANGPYKGMPRADMRVFEIRTKC